MKFHPKTETILGDAEAHRLLGREYRRHRATLRGVYLLALIVGLIVTVYAHWLTGWVPSGHRFL